MASSDQKRSQIELEAGVVLAGEQIEELVRRGQLIAPDTFEPLGLDACSYDVRIGDKGVLGGNAEELNLHERSLTVIPGGYAAVISRERVAIPNNILVRINSKRSVAYQGLALLTGTQIDPGYTGHLLFGFYNTSSRKVILRRNQPICSLVFEPLAREVANPKGPDQDLLHGNFPGRFVNEMANMEVLSLQELSKEVKQLERMNTEIINLRAKYDDVIEPIKQQTANVNKLSNDVDKLRESITLLNEVTERHGNRLTTLSEKFSKLSIVAYIFWGIVLVVLGAAVSWAFSILSAGGSR